MDTFVSTLAKFTSHFDLERDEACTAYLTGPSIKNIRDRIEDDKQLYMHDTQNILREHFICRDRNLTLYLDYKESMLGGPSLERKMLDMAKEHPRSMVSLSNLTFLKIVMRKENEAESYLKKLRKMKPLERVLADAEIAYAYLKLGPPGHLKCKRLSEKVVYFDDDYPGLSELDAPDREVLDELRVQYSYVGALAIERILAQNEHGDVLEKEGCGRPEELMKESINFLKRVVSQKSREYATIGYLVLRSTFHRYRNIIPQTERSISSLSTFPWPALNPRSPVPVADQCLAIAVKAVEKVGLQDADYRVLDRLGNEYRKFGENQDLNKAERYLKAAAERSRRPAIYHHLGLLYRQKWQKERRLRDKQNPDRNFRDKGNPLLKKAIEYFKKANFYSHNTFVLFQVDLARVKYSYCDDTKSEESRNEIMDDLNGCVLHTVRRGLTTSGDQAYLFNELALMYKAMFHDKDQCRNYYQLSIEHAIKAKKYSPALKDLVEMLVEENRHAKSELHTTLGLMYNKFKLYEKAVWNLDRACEIKNKKGKKKAGARSAADHILLETLADSLIGQKKFHSARQCLIVLKTNNDKYLERPDKREQYMNASLMVAIKFPQDTAATIYQELITELKPNIKASSVVVISSEEKSDNCRTKALVRMLRQGLGFTEDNCILPMEKTQGEFYGVSEYIEHFVKKAWCIIIHLTDIVLQNEMGMLQHDIDNSIRYILNRKGQVIVVNDVKIQAQKLAARTTSGQLPRCQQWIEWGTLFGSSNAAKRETKDASTDDMASCGSKSGIGQIVQEKHAAGPGDVVGQKANRVPHAPHPAFQPLIICTPRTKKVQCWKGGASTGDAGRAVPPTHGDRAIGPTQRENNIPRNVCCEPTFEEIGVPESEGNAMSDHVDRVEGKVAGIGGRGAGIDDESAAPQAGELVWDVEGLETLVRAMLTPSSTGWCSARAAPPRN